MTVRTRSMSHSADYRSQPEATLEVPQLSGKARCAGLRAVAAVPTGSGATAGHSRLVRNRPRGLLGHEQLGRLEQYRTGAHELELVLLAGSPSEARQCT